MNKKFKDALKNAYNIPEPAHKEEFLRSIQKEEEKKVVPFWIPLVKYGSVPVTAAVALLICAGFMDTEKVKHDYVEVEQTEACDENLSEETDTTIVTLTTETTKNPALTSDLTLTEEAFDVTSEATASGEGEIVVTTAMVTKPVTKPVTNTATATVTTASATSPTSTVTTVKTTEPTENSVTTTSRVTQPAPVTTTGTTVTTTDRTTLPAPVITTRTTATTLGDYNSTRPDVPIMTTTREPVYEPTITTREPLYEPSDPGIDAPTDPGYWVTPEHNYTMSPIVIEMKNNNATASYWKSQCRSSEAAVWGRIENVYYTSIDGLPYTQADITVTHDYKGIYTSGQKLSLYAFGGYMPLRDYAEENGFLGMLDGKTDEEIDNTSVYYNFAADFTDYLTAGREYLFFVSQSGIVPGGAMMINGEIYIPQNNIFYNRWGSREFTCSELIDCINS